MKQALKQEIIIQAKNKKNIKKQRIKLKTGATTKAQYCSNNKKQY